MGKNSTIFFNSVINKKELKKILEWAFKTHGQIKATYLVDHLKEIGFDYATKSGLSISIEDLRVPPTKPILMQEANFDLFMTDVATNSGEITEVEKFRKTIYIWNSTSEYLKDELIEYLKKYDPLNSLYIMAFSGARGNITQVRQLVGMRGLMSDSSGQIVEKAIGANFREGLSVTDYIISSYGARKGLVDTSIKTADSGYLTRRLVEVVQSTIVSELDCRTERGLALTIKASPSSEMLTALKEKAIGRILAFPVYMPGTNIIVAQKNQQITSIIVEKFIELKIKNIVIRSALTCQCRRAVCQQCYGVHLASGDLVDLGESIGLIAAQSIGEPGTQLTMRTFHTGGIVTSEVTRRSKSGQLGIVELVPDMKAIPFRTVYGEDTLFVQEACFVYIRKYSNIKLKIPVPEQNLIFAKNDTWIRPSDVLFDVIPELNQKGIKELRSIVTRESGEIILAEDNVPHKAIDINFGIRTKKNYSLWVLAGSVFSTPLQASIKARPFRKVYRYQSISESKITTFMGGFVHFCYDKVLSELRNLKIHHSTQNLESFKIFLEKTSYEITNCKLYLSNTHGISLKPEKFNDKFISIGDLSNKHYQTKTGGEFYVFDYHKPNRVDSYVYNDRVQCGCTIFYVPKTTILTDLNIKSFKFKKDTFVEKYMEILPDCFINISGFITFEVEKKKVKRIIIIPGQRYFFNLNEIDYEQLSEQVFFPGELVLGKYKIETLSYLEIGNNTKGKYIQIRPITRYEITKEKSLESFEHNSFLQGSLKIEDFNLNIKTGGLVATDGPVQLISSPITLRFPQISKYGEFFFEFIGPKKKNYWGQIKLTYSQTFFVEMLVPKEVKKKEIYLSINVEENQFIEPYTIFSTLKMIMLEDDYINTIKRQTNGKQSKVVIITESNFDAIFFDDFNQTYKKNSFLNNIMSLQNRLITRACGLTEPKYMGNQYRYRQGRPYLFANRGLIHKLPNDFVKSQDALGQLMYEKFKAGDIVQGLPKIEAILEARNPSNEAFLATNLGIITNISTNINDINISINPSNPESSYSLIRSSRLVVKRFEFINVGEPLTEGPINPHTLLYVYFRYFCSLSTLSMYEAAYHSTKKLQIIVFNSVQAIYRSQGVIISNKHLELIVKEMTNKVCLDYAGETDFLPGDIIDLDQAKYINLCTKGHNKLVFRPVLLGITKSSLKKEGFLAAASFQETTKVLTQAAIKGKTDWLRGLKENIITGRLIPSGTGFYANSDLTHNKVLIPRLNSTTENNFSLQNKVNLQKKKLKKLMQFKYNT